jgi:LacI family transcriptional regulator
VENNLSTAGALTALASLPNIWPNVRLATPKGKTYVVKGPYPSIKEVAARAGVSFQTASKFLNGGQVRVSPETAERITSAARELGYSPNTIARSLVQRASSTIGIVAGDLTDLALSQFVVGAERAARRVGHAVLVGTLAGDEEDGSEVVNTLIKRRVDGIIAAAPQLEEDTAVAELLRRYTAVVSLHHVPGGGIPTVGSNHRDLGRMCTEHLLNLGHSCVGTVTGPFRRLVVRSRLRGFEDALRQASIEPSEDLVVDGDWTPAGAASATRLLLERAQRRDGHRRLQRRGRHRTPHPR